MYSHDANEKSAPAQDKGQAPLVVSQTGGCFMLYDDTINVNLLLESYSDVYPTSLV